MTPRFTTTSITQVLQVQLLRPVILDQWPVCKLINKDLTAIWDFCSCCICFSLSMATTRRRTSSWNWRSFASFCRCSWCRRNSSCWAELCDNKALIVWRQIGDNRQHSFSSLPWWKLARQAHTLQKNLQILQTQKNFINHIHYALRKLLTAVQW